jgi:hypothetical protein
MAFELLTINGANGVESLRAHSLPGRAAHVVLLRPSRPARFRALALSETNVPRAMI